jgi:adenylate cyclase, class 2
MHEIEVKLPVGTPDDARVRLGRAGAVPRTPRLFEDNRLYDDASGTLRAKQQVLRLRSTDGTHKVTFKAPLADGADEGRYKIRVEHETTVGDAGAFDELLRGLGYAPVWRYQKYRQSYTLGPTLAELDETPIGVFIEIEGAPGEIDRAAAKLGFSPGDYVTKTYRQLQEEHTGSSDPGDLVFSPPPT